jgi:hypothetical protein
MPVRHLALPILPRQSLLSCPVLPGDLPQKPSLHAALSHSPVLCGGCQGCGLAPLPPPPPSTDQSLLSSTVSLCTGTSLALPLPLLHQPASDVLSCQAYALAPAPLPSRATKRRCMRCRWVLTAAANIRGEKCSWMCRRAAAALARASSLSRGGAGGGEGRGGGREEQRVRCVTCGRGEELGWGVGEGAMRVPAAGNHQVSSVVKA